jgi:hypothetical protein
MQLWGCHIIQLTINVSENSSHVAPYSWLDACFEPPSIKLTKFKSLCTMDMLSKKETSLFTNVGAMHLQNKREK